MGGYERMAGASAGPSVTRAYLAGWSKAGTGSSSGVNTFSMRSEKTRAIAKARGARVVAAVLGALSVIFAFRAGGAPVWVMPLVFAGAPIVNVLYTMWAAPAEEHAQPAALPRLRAGGERRLAGAALQATGLAA